MPRRRDKVGEKLQPVEKGVSRPYPSSPSIPPKYCLHFRYPHDAPIGEGRRMTQTFVGTYAAKKFIEEVIGSDDMKWPNLHTLVTSSGIMIYCNPPSNRMKENDLERVFNYSYTPQEEEWQLDSNALRIIQVFKRPYSSEEMKMQAKPVSSRKSSAGVPKPYGDLVSVSDICAELGIKPRDGRSALRKSSFKKPAYGWQFERDSEELKAITTFLKGAHL